jgi:uncharacterized protein with PIN domain
MLGTLAKWLRLMGFDTAYAGSISDGELKRFALSEKRVILTRDRELSGNKDVEAVFVESDDLDTQLIGTIRSLSLMIEEPMSRCSSCNGLFEEIDHDEAEGAIPEDILDGQGPIFRCRDCGKHYWQGSHWEGILERIERIRNQVS